MTPQEEADIIKDNEQVGAWLVLESEVEKAETLEELMQLLGIG